MTKKERLKKKRDKMYRRRLSKYFTRFMGALYSPVRRHVFINEFLGITHEELSK